MKPLEIVSVSLPWAETVTSVRTQSCYPQGERAGSVPKFNP